MTEIIKEFGSQKPLGFIETDSMGNKKIKNFAGRILGFYDKGSNLTKNSSMKPIAFGDISAGFLMKEL